MNPGNLNMPGSATFLNRPVRQITVKAEEICVVILRRGTHRGPVDDPPQSIFGVLIEGSYLSRRQKANIIQTRSECVPITH